MPPVTPGNQTNLATPRNATQAGNLNATLMLLQVLFGIRLPQQGQEFNLAQVDQWEYDPADQFLIDNQFTSGNQGEGKPTKAQKKAEKARERQERFKEQQEYEDLSTEVDQELSALEAKLKSAAKLLRRAANFRQEGEGQDIKQAELEEARAQQRLENLHERLENLEEKASALAQSKNKKHQQTHENLKGAVKLVRERRSKEEETTQAPASTTTNAPTVSTTTSPTDPTTSTVRVTDPTTGDTTTFTAPTSSAPTTVSSSSTTTSGNTTTTVIEGTTSTGEPTTTTITQDSTTGTTTTSTTSQGLTTNTVETSTSSITFTTTTPITPTTQPTTTTNEDGSTTTRFDATTTTGDPITVQTTQDPSTAATTTVITNSTTQETTTTTTTVSSSVASTTTSSTTTAAPTTTTSNSTTSVSTTTSSSNPDITTTTITVTDPTTGTSSVTTLTTTSTTPTISTITSTSTTINEDGSTTTTFNGTTSTGAPITVESTQNPSTNETTTITTSQGQVTTTTSTPDGISSTSTTAAPPTTSQQAPSTSAPPQGEGGGGKESQAPVIAGAAAGGVVLLALIFLGVRRTRRKARMQVEEGVGSLDSIRMRDVDQVTLSRQLMVNAIGNSTDGLYYLQTTNPAESAAISFLNATRDSRLQKLSSIEGFSNQEAGNKLKQEKLISEIAGAIFASQHTGGRVAAFTGKDTYPEADDIYERALKLSNIIAEKLQVQSTPNLEVGDVIDALVINILRPANISLENEQLVDLAIAKAPELQPQQQRRAAAAPPVAQNTFMDLGAEMSGRGYVREFDLPGRVSETVIDNLPGQAVVDEGNGTLSTFQPQGRTPGGQRTVAFLYEESGESSTDDEEEDTPQLSHQDNLGQQARALFTYAIEKKYHEGLALNEAAIADLQDKLAKQDDKSFYSSIAETRSSADSGVNLRKFLGHLLANDLSGITLTPQEESGSVLYAQARKTGDKLKKADVIALLKKMQAANLITNEQILQTTASAPPAYEAWRPQQTTTAGTLYEVPEDQRDHEGSGHQPTMVRNPGNVYNSARGAREEHDGEAHVSVARATDRRFQRVAKAVVSAQRVAKILSAHAPETENSPLTQEQLIFYVYAKQALKSQETLVRNLSSQPPAKQAEIRYLQQATKQIEKNKNFQQAVLQLPKNPGADGKYHLKITTIGVDYEGQQLKFPNEVVVDIQQLAGGIKYQVGETIYAAVAHGESHYANTTASGKSILRRQRVPVEESTYAAVDHAATTASSLLSESGSLLKLFEGQDLPENLNASQVSEINALLKESAPEEESIDDAAGESSTDETLRKLKKALEEKLETLIRKEVKSPLEDRQQEILKLMAAAKIIEDPEAQIRKRAESFTIRQGWLQHGTVVAKDGATQYKLRDIFYEATQQPEPNTNPNTQGNELTLTYQGNHAAAINEKIEKLGLDNEKNSITVKFRDDKTIVTATALHRELGLPSKNARPVGARAAQQNQKGGGMENNG